MSNDKRNEIEQLIDKAAKVNDSSDALRFSQAACNAAQAMRCVADTENTRSQIDIAFDGNAGAR